MYREQLEELEQQVTLMESRRIPLGGYNADANDILALCTITKRILQYLIPRAKRLKKEE